MQKGDKNAESELAKELNENPLAAWAVKHWSRVQKGKGAPSPKISTSNNRAYGNAFKPYQGGAPGLGKKS